MVTDLDRIDIMLDIETMGLDGDAPILQIAAQAFNLKTGELICKDGIGTLNIFRSLESMDDIRGASLSFWLDENIDKLKSYTAYELLHKQCDSYYANDKDMIEHFNAWVYTLAHSFTIPDDENFKCFTRPDIYLWGNGILFDNKLISNKCEKFNLGYPIDYRCNRDFKTVIDLAAQIKGLSYSDYYNMFTWDGCKHDALDDCLNQIKILCKSYQVIMNEKVEDDG